MSKQNKPIGRDHETPVIVRRARTRDRTAVQLLSRASFGADMADSLAAFGDPHGFAASLSSPDFVLLIAARGANVVGFALATPFLDYGRGRAQDRSAFTLAAIAVSERFRGTGVGGQMIAHVESAVRTRGAVVLTAEIPVHLTSFYRRSNWLVAGEDFGWAWCHRGRLQADCPGTDAEYPLIAIRTIDERGLVLLFRFPNLSSRPLVDAHVELDRLIRVGKVDERTLPPLVAVQARDFARRVRHVEG